MKKVNISRIVILTCTICIYAHVVFAQEKSSSRGAKDELPTKISEEDSLATVISNMIYSSFYNPTFWSKYKVPTYTTYKVDFDISGKVTSIRFSDSAELEFVNGYKTRKWYHNDIETLEKYGKLKDYKDISLLIPVQYNPDYTPNKVYEYEGIDLLRKFDGKEFNGKSIQWKPIKIFILERGNS